MTTPTSTLPICTACGTQYPANPPPSNCPICDDPRQFVPATGQSWTTLAELQSKHRNKITQDRHDPRIYYIAIEPKAFIGQRAILLCTDHGNVLWDMIALIDDETRRFIEGKGGLKAIVISHPHYYTTHAEWAAAFPGVPIHTGSDDRAWFQRPPLTPASHVGLQGARGAAQSIIPGVTAIKAGGHFPGSLLLHWDRKLFIADTIVTVPSAYTPHPRPKGQTSYVFQWSIPNSIPLNPRAIMGVWESVSGFEWEETHGAFAGMDIMGHGETAEARTRDMKGRMLESMKIQVRAEGWEDEDAEVLRQGL